MYQRNNLITKEDILSAKCKYKKLKLIEQAECVKYGGTIDWIHISWKDEITSMKINKHLKVVGTLPLGDVYKVYIYPSIDYKDRGTYFFLEERLDSNRESCQGIRKEQISFAAYYNMDFRIINSRSNVLNNIPDMPWLAAEKYLKEMYND